MDTKQVIKGIAALALVGAAFNMAYAENGSTEPAVEVQPITSGAPTADKTQASESSPAAIEVNVQNPDASVTDNAGSAQKTDAPAPVAAKAPAAEPNMIQRAVGGVTGLYERAKAFVMPSDK